MERRRLASRGAWRDVLATQYLALSRVCLIRFVFALAVCMGGVGASEGGAGKLIGGLDPRAARVRGGMTPGVYNPLLQWGAPVPNSLLRV